MLIQILATMASVLVIAGMGTLYAYFRSSDLGTLNKLNLELFAPLLVFAVLARQTTSLSEYTDLVLAASVVVLGSGVILYPVAKRLNLQVKTFLPPMMFKNSGNMGMPLLILSFGENILPIAVILSIVGMLLHFSVGLFMLDPKSSMLQRLKIPLVFASVAGLVVNLGDIYVPSWLLESAELLGGVCIPLMLFSMGVRMIDLDLSGWRLGLLGAVACPATGLVLAWPMIHLLEISGVHAAALWVFAALPPAVMNYMVAEQYQQEPHKVASLVLLSNLGSLVVMPIVLGLVFAAGYV